MREGPPLFLFDIDGTLMKGGTGVHRASFGHAFSTVYGLDLSLDGIPAGGRTDTWLLAEPLRRYGLTDDEIWAKMPHAFEAIQDYAEQYLGDLSQFVLPGVPELLERLRSGGELMGLLTGNLSRVAHAKLRHAGLGGYFTFGGFGEESEVRSHLVPVALRHAAVLAGGPIRPSRVVIIGDTPLDIEAGRIHGTRTVGVATGVSAFDELLAAGADLVLPSVEDVDRAIVQIMAVVTAS